MIICIEGGDASGKATQSKILADRLGCPRFTFPDYETPAGKAILGNLKNEWAGASWHAYSGTHRLDKQTNALVLQSLMATNRLERGAELREAARAGHVVLDRYDASAMVYGGLDGLDPAWIAAVNAQLPVRPDLYLLVDVPVDEGFRRRPERRDRYEKDRSYLERVREGYLRLFAERQAARSREMRAYSGAPPLGTPARWVTIDGLGAVETVAERIWNACVQAGV